MKRTRGVDGARAATRDRGARIRHDEVGDQVDTLRGRAQPQRLLPSAAASTVAPLEHREVGPARRFVSTIRSSRSSRWTRSARVGRSIDEGLRQIDLG